MKKSTFNTLLGGFIASIAIATFLGGYAIGSFDDNPESHVTDEIRGEINSQQKINPTADQPTSPTEELQSTQQRSSQISIDGEPVKGDPDAPVTMIEFSDFQCPFCSRFTIQTLPLLEQYYIDTGEVKIVYKDLPLRIHSNARSAHIAAECAHEQGKFWDYHDILFSQQSQWSRQPSSNLNSVFIEFADNLGIEKDSFTECLSSVEISVEIDEDIFDAARNDAQGTPTFFIGSEEGGFTKIVGAQPYYVFAEIIDSKLES